MLYRHSGDKGHAGVGARVVSHRTGAQLATVALVAALLGWCVATPTVVHAEVQTVADLGARIDWAKGEVRVTAAVPAPKKSKPATLKASALGLAQGNLRKLLSRVATGGGDTYAIPEDATGQAALAKRAQILSAGAVAGGRYQVVISLVLPKVPAAAEGAAGEADGAAGMPKRRFTDPDPAQVRTYPPLDPNAEAGLLTPADARGPFTGLIVDTRGLDLRNAMSPRLLDVALRDVYNGIHASVDYVEDVGVVGYMGSIAAALKNPRVGSRPLVVRAVGVGDAHRTYPVVSLEDARRFLGDAGAGRVTATCAVCFIIDSLAARDGPPSPAPAPTPMPGPPSSE